MTLDGIINESLMTKSKKAAFTTTGYFTAWSDILRETKYYMLSEHLTDTFSVNINGPGKIHKISTYPHYVYRRCKPVAIKFCINI